MTLTLVTGSARSFASRHGLVPFDAPCNGCGEIRRVDVPFARGKQRGLRAQPCACGDGSFAPYCVAWETL